jgi:hypothetical protein
MGYSALVVPRCCAHHCLDLFHVNLILSMPGEFADRPPSILIKSATKSTRSHFGLVCRPSVSARSLRVSIRAFVSGLQRVKTSKAPRQRWHSLSAQISLRFVWRSEPRSSTYDRCHNFASAVVIRLCMRCECDVGGRGAAWPRTSSPRPTPQARTVISDRVDHGCGRDLR